MIARAINIASAVGRAAVVETGVGDVETGQLRHQRLILERRLQRALARLGLVGSIGRVELAARGQVVDDRRNEVVVAPAAQETDPLVGPLVEGQDGADVIGQLQLRKSGGDPKRMSSAAASGGIRSKSCSRLSSPIALSIKRVSSGVFAI